MVQAFKNEPYAWKAADKLMEVVKTAGFNTNELSSYCRKQDLFQEQVEGWHQTEKNENANEALSMAEKKEFERF